MEDKDIEKLFYSNPDKLFSMIEENGRNLEDLKKLQLVKLLVKTKFPELQSKKYDEAVDFVFWFAYFVEREIRDSIFYVEEKLEKPEKQIDVMVDDMDFGEKIKFIEDNYNNDSKSSSYIKALRGIKNIRNHMAHGRLDKLEYGGYHLSDPRGQLKLIIQLVNSSLNRELIK